MLICCARTVVLYLLLVFGMRLMGKKQVGELEPTELVLAMCISDLASVPMQDFGIPLLFGVIPIVILLCLTMIMSELAMKSEGVRLLLCGRPSVVVSGGVIVQQEMEKNRFTCDELLEELRLQGVTDLSAVKYAILETSGQISVILYESEQPLTPSQLNLDTVEHGLPAVIISDGRLRRRNLRLRKLDEQWLKAQLTKHGVKCIEQVFLLSVDEDGQTCFLKKEKL